jgi:hypothetical protein
MQVTEAADEITLQLQARPGTRFDTSEIAACLDHTIAKVQQR